jgi:glycosyltransferase involved in cell wall biosynthesis
VTTEPHGVTVVVPAYNVERYLGDCLDSLLAQTAWPDCRVIVVDDGSTDGTATIADDYADRHPAISVMHQPNSGPGAGAARNRGLDQVQTEFVWFLDGDDELTPPAVELLRDGLESHRLNLAVGNSEQFPQSRAWLWSGYFVPGEGRAARIEDLPLLAHDARTCNKLYRTSWLRETGLRFAEGIHHQDTVVNVPAMLLAEELYVAGDVVYRYRKRAEGGSVMDSHYTRLGNYWDHLQVIEELDAMRPRFSPVREPLMQAFIARSFQGFSWRAPSTVPTGRLREFFDRAAAVIRTLDPDIIESATRVPGERTAYVTMLEDDFSSFQRLDELAGRFLAHDGDLFLGVPVRPEHRRLLALGSTRALVTVDGLDQSGVNLRIRLRIKGADRPGEHLLRTTVRGLAGDKAVFGADVTWTGDEGNESIGGAFLPWSAIRESGAFFLRLQFRTETGTAARWIRRAEVDGTWEPDEIRNNRFAQLTLSAGPEGRATLTVAPTVLLQASRALAKLRRPREPSK